MPTVPHLVLTIESAQVKCITMNALSFSKKNMHLELFQEGTLEVKTVGGVTITKKIDGKIELSTKKNKAANDKGWKFFTFVSHVIDLFFVK